MKNKKVNEAITGEISKLATLILGNPGCYLEVNKRDGNQWTLYKEKIDWEEAPEEKDACEKYVEDRKLTSSSEFDFPGVSGVDCIDPVLYEAMAVALGITLAPEE